MTINSSPAPGAAPAAAATVTPAAIDRIHHALQAFAKGTLAKLYCDRHQRISRPKLLFTIAVLDVLAVALSGLAAGDMAALIDGVAKGEFWRECGVGILVVTVLNRHWSYTVAALRSGSGQIMKAATSALTVFLAIAGASFVLQLQAWTPWHIAIWMMLSIALLSTMRLVTAPAIEALAAQGLMRRRTVIAGGGKEAQELLEVLSKEDAGHLEILGVFDDRHGDRLAEYPGTLEKLGTFEELSAFCQKSGVDLAIVTVPPRAEERLLQILQKLFALEVDIRVSALNSKLRLNANAYSYIGDVPMLAVMDKPLSDWDRVLKNVEDRVLGLLILIAVSPIMLAVAAAVRFTSNGPVLFKQKRYGFNNELIEVYKFRSMFTDMSDATASKLVTKGDPRVTPVGRIIRRTSLDELPQLFNVLTGQMSLVGPRPHATQAKAGADLYENVVQEYFARHRVKPGVTGWAQINGWRGETDTQEKIQRRVEYDLHYIDNWSVLLDLYIIVMTPFALISGKNAY